MSITVIKNILLALCTVEGGPKRHVGALNDEFKGI